MGLIGLYDEYGWLESNTFQMVEGDSDFSWRDAVVAEGNNTWDVFIRTNESEIDEFREGNGRVGLFGDEGDGDFLLFAFVFVLDDDFVSELAKDIRFKIYL